MRDGKGVYVTVPLACLAFTSALFGFKIQAEDNWPYVLLGIAVFFSFMSMIIAEFGDKKKWASDVSEYYRLAKEFGLDWSEEVHSYRKTIEDVRIELEALYDKFEIIAGHPHILSGREEPRVDIESERERMSYYAKFDVSEEKWKINESIKWKAGPLSWLEEKCEEAAVEDLPRLRRLAKVKPASA